LKAAISFTRHIMDHDRLELSGSELIRWLVVAVLIIAGIGLFFYFAPSTRPVVRPSVEESGL
jgi:uncharacterized BrkB/YihY/UPF0761 family membrane protein